MPIFTGAGTAIVTPFDADGNINFNVFANLIEFQIANGIDAIIVCGTTGEAATLSYEERYDAVRFVVEQVRGRVPVISGGGSNSTATSIRLCLDGQKAGADGLLLVTPYYNKATQKGLIAHYSAIADVVDLPMILYNVPTRTGLNMQPQTVYALSKNPRIAGIKEASGDIAQAAVIASLCDDGFDLYAGNCNEVLPLLSLGAKGCISVSGNVAPQNLHDLVAKFNAGDIAGARKLQLDLIPLVEAVFCELSPLPVKYMLNEMGYAVGGCRLPLTYLEEESKAIVKQAMKNYGLI